MSRLYARLWAALTDRFVLSQEDIDALVAERVASRPRAERVASRPRD